jgi:23S rRNA pseudouridine2605 synthase
LTNDGALARILELPSTGWLRRYRVRAHGTITQDKLDSVRDGVTIAGIHYGPIEAVLDRAQGSNVWLTLAIREGKNREVRNVLGHFGLAVTRLIRLSFGPFQLGELAEGAIEEVRTRVLRDQLGEKLVRLSGADFSTPRTTPHSRPRTTPHGRPRQDEAPRAAPQKPQEVKKRNSSAHAWRAHDEGRPAKKLRRRFHGARGYTAKTQPRPDGQARADVLTDRKGRPVAVERYPALPPTEATQHNERGSRHKSGHRRRYRSPDRASGRRPSRPRGDR